MTAALAGHDLGATGARRNLVSRVLTVPIHAYRWLFAWRAPVCRYDPSCSNYAIEAIETHGALKGMWLSTKRLGRCHPWGGHGWDPVPPRKTPGQTTSSGEAGEK